MLDDTIFTVKSQTENAINDAVATPGMVSQATIFINYTLGVMNMALVSGFKKITSPSASSHKQVVDIQLHDMQNISVSKPDINAQLEQAHNEIDRLRAKCEAKLKMKNL